MFDLSFGHLVVVGAVALVVLGPERLPKVARTVGEWIGKAQRYVAQVKNDINREFELAELKKLQDEAREAAQSMQTSLQSVESDLNKSTSELTTAFDMSSTADVWEGAGEVRTRFHRRYRPGPSIDELAEEIARLRKRLDMPNAQYSGDGTFRRKRTPRSRANRARIYR